jgi:hypothetical protein
MRSTFFAIALLLATAGVGGAHAELARADTELNGMHERSPSLPPRGGSTTKPPPSPTKPGPGPGGGGPVRANVEILD